MNHTYSCFKYLISLILLSILCIKNFPIQSHKISDAQICYESLTPEVLQIAMSANEYYPSLPSFLTMKVSITILLTNSSTISKSVIYYLAITEGFCSNTLQFSSKSVDFYSYIFTVEFYLGYEQILLTKIETLISPDFTEGVHIFLDEYDILKLYVIYSTIGHIIQEVQAVPYEIVRDTIKNRYSGLRYVCMADRLHKLVIQTDIIKHKPFPDFISIVARLFQNHIADVILEIPAWACDSTHARILYPKIFYVRYLTYNTEIILTFNRFAKFPTPTQILQRENIPKESVFTSPDILLVDISNYDGCIDKKENTYLLSSVEYSHKDNNEGITVTLKPENFPLEYQIKGWVNPEKGLEIYRFFYPPFS